MIRTEFKLSMDNPSLAELEDCLSRGSFVSNGAIPESLIPMPASNSRRIRVEEIAWDYDHYLAFVRILTEVIRK